MKNAEQIIKEKCGNALLHSPMGTAIIEAMKEYAKQPLTKLRGRCEILLTPNGFHQVSAVNEDDIVSLRNELK